MWCWQFYSASTDSRLQTGQNGQFIEPVGVLRKCHRKVSNATCNSARRSRKQKWCYIWATSSCISGRSHKKHLGKTRLGWNGISQWPKPGPAWLSPIRDCEGETWKSTFQWGFRTPRGSRGILSQIPVKIGPGYSIRCLKSLAPWLLVVDTALRADIGKENSGNPLRCLNAKHFQISDNMK
jgi:hypothetical protein